MNHELTDRRCALQALYQMDASNSQDQGLVGVVADDGDAEDARAIERGMALAAAAWKFRNEADAQIAELAKEWPPYRQPIVDRNLLRLGWYELRHTEAPPRKVISDAVELAKEFGTVDSGKFVNAVLDRLWKGEAPTEA
ncbi:MAG: transcription antitermination factor NusB [Phycisphaerae bacterium]|nr:transcription antitermination factor NusB [Phycisphaerae bacterium]